MPYIVHLPYANLRDKYTIFYPAAFQHWTLAFLCNATIQYSQILWAEMALGDLLGWEFISATTNNFHF